MAKLGRPRRGEVTRHRDWVGQYRGTGPGQCRHRSPPPYPTAIRPSIADRHVYCAHKNVPGTQNDRLGESFPSGAQHTPEGRSIRMSVPMSVRTSIRVYCVAQHEVNGYPPATVDTEAVAVIRVHQRCPVNRCLRPVLSTGAFGLSCQHLVPWACPANRCLRPVLSTAALGLSCQHLVPWACPVNWCLGPVMSTFGALGLSCQHLVPWAGPVNTWCLGPVPSTLGCPAAVTDHRT